jgi:hypothetical protein
MDLLAFELVNLESETAVKKIAIMMRIHDETVRIEIFAVFLCDKAPKQFTYS